MKVKFCIACIAILLILTLNALAQTSTTESPFSQVQVGDITAWVKKNKIEFKASASETDNEDLQWMKSTFKNTKVLALGEATHGTHEFFACKSRMIKFLVKEMGYRNIAIEANNLTCRAINEFILTSAGNLPNMLLKLGPFSGGTGEMMELINWLNTYNKTMPVNDKVKFFGFDIQGNEELLISVKAYLKKVDPVYAAKKDSLLNIMKQLSEFSYDFKNNSNSQKFVDSSFVKFYILLSNLEVNRGLYIAKSSQKEYQDFLNDINLAAQQMISSYNDKFIDFRFDYSWSKRDYYMADNFLRFVQSQNPDAKFIVWSHNNHISINPASNESGSVKPMGSHLRDVFANKYYSIGFFFNEGSFYAEEVKEDRHRYGMNEFTANQPGESSVEWMLSRGGDNYFLGLTGVSAGNAAKTFISSPLNTWNFGWGVIRGRESDYKVTTILEKDYDGIIFIHKTSAGKFLK